MDTLETWHRMLEHRDMAPLDEILAQDCVFTISAMAYAILPRCTGIWAA